MNTPSAEALKLAALLSGHTHCQISLREAPVSCVCIGCLGDAATIDRELQLPQRNAALLCAQAVIDAMEGNRPSDDDAIDQLREALENIKTTP